MPLPAPEPVRAEERILRIAAHEAWWWIERRHPAEHLELLLLE